MMNLREFIGKNRRRYQAQGASATLRSMARETYGKLVLRPYIKARQYWWKQELSNQSDSLNKLQDKDEFLLLVFDAGRHDYMKPILEDQFKTTAFATFSAARDTFEWISTQWVSGVDDVTYITGMTPIDSEKPDYRIDAFNELYHTDAFTNSMREIVPVWKERWDIGVSSVPPEQLVDAALEYIDRDKVVVHFNQPHSPFIGIPKLLGHTNNESAIPDHGEPNDQPIWDRVQSGKVSDFELRMAYQGNAVRAVQAATKLVEEWDGENIIATADHGEALGEWGMYTHDRAPHPKRRIVPWALIDGVSESPEGEAREVSRQEQLEALGYR